MIETFFGLDALGTPQAFFAAFAIGLAFGFILERAGFGSSRRLAGIFYFRDMAVVKVMFSALITAMLGLCYLLALGWISPDQLFFMPTVYGAQMVGGLLFGVGFVMSGWCPGTGVVGLASGKLDALIFLVGTLLGTILFNEIFALVKPLYTLGDSGVRFIFETMGLSRAVFAFAFTTVAILCFWGSELIEGRKKAGGLYFNTPFLKSYSLGLLVIAGGLFIVSGDSPALSVAASERAAAPLARSRYASPGSESALLQTIAHGGDHMGSMELADRLLRGDTDLLLVDIRTPAEYAEFHIRSAVNIQLPELPESLHLYRNKGMVVLYSNGMTHAAQARDALARLGFQNVYILTDGLQGFIETCLKPVSLRSEPLPDDLAQEINQWRQFFLYPAATVNRPPAETLDQPAMQLPGLVETTWLAENLRQSGLKIIDLRTQPEYNTRHIPGSLFLSVESLRGMVGGVPSMLLPAQMLALHMSQMGIEPSDLVLLVYGEKPMDATLAGMALERLGHQKVAILSGGFNQWAAENLPTDNALPAVSQSRYPAADSMDHFTVDHATVLGFMKDQRTVILDVRPSEFYQGKKSDEARAGHIPGALNRPFSEDLVKVEGATLFKPVDELAAAYAALIPSKETRVIVHCRTGHQASQTFFVLKRLLGYRQVLWYDAGWTEWAARPELPIEKDG